MGERLIVNQRDGFEVPTSVGSDRLRKHLAAEPQRLVVESTQATCGQAEGNFLAAALFAYSDFNQRLRAVYERYGMVEPAWLQSPVVVERVSTNMHTKRPTRGLGPMFATRLHDTVLIGKARGLHTRSPRLALTGPMAGAFLVPIVDQDGPPYENGLVLDRVFIDRPIDARYAGIMQQAYTPFFQPDYIPSEEQQMSYFQGARGKGYVSELEEVYFAAVREYFGVDSGNPVSTLDVLRSIVPPLLPNDIQFDPEAFLYARKK